ncbi:MAG: CehA/McbA family metallohydrolase [Planctomycetes bacterium]|nr:CehA/McbA family metallohydrolase [Planctomycetota bacterium]
MKNHELIAIDGGGGCTRRHAIKIFAACAGGAVLGRCVPRAWADLPWSEEPPAALLSGDSKPLALGRESSYKSAARQAYPALAREPSGKRLWTTWSQLHGDREAILLRCFDIRDEKWNDVQSVSTPDADAATAAYEAELAFVGGRVVVVWSQWNGDGWTLHVRSFDPQTGQFGDAQTLAGTPGAGEVHCHAALAAGHERALVVWQGKAGGSERYAVFGRLLDVRGAPLGDVFGMGVDEERDCCRPAVAARPDGSGFAVAYERHDQPGTQNIYVAQLNADGVPIGQPQALTQHAASDVAPALAFAPDGGWLWVAWHSNRQGTQAWDVTPWYRLAALRTGDNTWHEPATRAAPAEGSERGTVQGFELVRLAVSPNGVVCVLGRASHNFYVQYYGRDGRSPLYRLPQDGWGGRGRLLRGEFDSTGGLWVARRDLGTNVLGRIGGFETLTGPPPVQPRNVAKRAETVAVAGQTPRYAWPESAIPTAGLKLYFGDIHGHSWQSDGMGDPEASHLRARDVFQDDFHALTDHDYFVGKRLNDAQWQEQKDVAEHYHEAGKFVPLFGQEWTTPRVKQPHGWGHFNIYSADPTIPLLDHKDPRWRDLPELYAALRPYEAIAIPHHIGWTGVPWETLDPGLTPVVEICSVHGAFEYEGNEPIRHRGGMSGCFYRDGLAAGLRVGVAGGSDQHGLTWHHGICWKRNAFRAGLTGVWAPELTRAAILDAFRARRTFATTGVKLQLCFAVNDALMGACIESAALPTLRVDVAVPPEEGRLAWLEIIRDGRCVHQYGGEAQRSRYTFVDATSPAGVTHSYYLRVRLAGGDMAWSSPVWVRRV